MSGGRSRRQCAECLSGPAFERWRSALFFAQRPRRSHAGAIHRGDDRAFRSGGARRRGAQPDVQRLRAGRWSIRRACTYGAGMRAPFRPFRRRADAWSDAANWETGHWLNGRLEGAPLDRLLPALAGAVSAPEVVAQRPNVERLSRRLCAGAADVAARGDRSSCRAFRLRRRGERAAPCASSIGAGSRCAKLTKTISSPAKPRRS